MAFLNVKIVSTRPLDIPRDVWRQILRHGHAAVGEVWHKEVLPEHFTTKAKFKYRHERRKPGYVKRKMAAAAAGRGISRQNPQPVLMGGQVDNVVTGTMMAELKRQRTVRAFPTRVTITIYGPQYMSARTFTGDAKRAIAEGWTYGKGKKFSRYSGNQPDKRKEITTTTIEERKRLSQVLTDTVASDLAAYRAPTTTTI
jgi:hypothetical protein